MEIEKKKQFIHPTVHLLEDVDALPLLAGSEDEVLVTVGFTLGSDDGATATTGSSGSKTLSFPGGF